MTEHDAHRWAVDSIDEGIARIEEDGSRVISIPVHLLPAGTIEGQVLRVAREPGNPPGTLVLTISMDSAGTESALVSSRATTAATTGESRKRDKGGDVSL